MILRALKRYGGLMAGLVAWALRLSFTDGSPVENFFFHRWFPLVKAFQSASAPLWVIPGYYLMALLGVAWVIWRVPRKWRSGKRWANFLRRLLNLCGGTAALFLVLWGYHYAGPDLRMRMNLPERAEFVDPAELYLHIMGEAEEARAAIPGAIDTSSVIDLPAPADSILLRAVGDVVRPLGYPALHRINVQRWWPAGTLRRLGIGGIYNPFTGEANVERLYGAVLGTFTTAHEMAHAYGITGEAEANFVAYLALLHMDDPMAAYAAHYALWRYSAKTVNELYPPEDRKRLAESIPLGLRADRAAIRNRLTAHAPYFPRLSDAVNDRYLKVQGVEAGVDDYDRFVNLYLDWRAATEISE